MPDRAGPSIEHQCVAIAVRVERCGNLLEACSFRWARTLGRGVGGGDRGGRVGEGPLLLPGKL